MITPAGPLSRLDRDAMRHTADMLALLPLPGCSELAMDLRCVADSAQLSPAQVDPVLARCEAVRRALLVESTPDRWVDLMDEVGQDVIDDLMTTRTAQAAQVAQVAEALSRSVHRARAVHG